MIDIEKRDNPYVYQEALLHEYESCDNLVGRLDSLIWQTASLFYPITLAGFAYFGSSSDHSTEQFPIILALAIGSLTLLVIWYFLSRQWYGYQAIAFYRMREIESELGLWHYQYSRFMRCRKNERKLFIDSLDERERTRFIKLESSVVHFPRIGLRAALTVITILFVIGWIGIIIREIILTYL
jgi:hypothetical protein